MKSTDYRIYRYGTESEAKNKIAFCLLLVHLTFEYIRNQLKLDVQPYENLS